MLDPAKIKKDFPIFGHIPGLVYLDSTATSLKPASVIQAQRRYYEEYSANIFRGIYGISEKATEEYEATRDAVAGFIHAASSREVIFTRNTSESINLLAYTLADSILSPEDEVVTTILEHHSNFVPWQQMALRKKGKFRVMGINKLGNLDPIDHYVTKKTKILALTYISNVLGAVNDVTDIINEAKRINPGIITVIDAAQAIPHRRVDVQALGADFIAFSSHKMLGPTGVGVLWGKEAYLNDLKPFMYGGEMIREVYTDKTVFKTTPHKFEAGTPAIGEVIALKESISYLEKVGMEQIEGHEQELARFATKRLLEEFPQIKVLGPKDRKQTGGIVSFWFDDVHPHDIAHFLAEDDICVRAGNHCAMPLHAELGISASVRASFYLYNEKRDVEKLIEGVGRALQILS